MPVTFPASPSVGDTYTLGEVTWEWSGDYWAQIPGSNLGAFYGFKYIPTTGQLSLEVINDGTTEVVLPDQDRRSTDYREWTFTTRDLEFEWSASEKTNLIVRVN